MFRTRQSRIQTIIVLFGEKTRSPMGLGQTGRIEDGARRVPHYRCQMMPADPIDESSTLYRIADAEIRSCISTYLELARATHGLTNVTPDRLQDERARTIVLAGLGLRPVRLPSAEEAQEAKAHAEAKGERRLHGQLATAKALIRFGRAKSA